VDLPLGDREVNALEDGRVIDGHFEALDLEDGISH
jgi:hypothetical protein